jgi:hypothetical protein
MYLNNSLNNNDDDDHARAFKIFDDDQSAIIKSQWVKATGSPITPTHVLTIQKYQWGYEELIGLLEYVAFNQQTIKNKAGYILRVLKGGDTDAGTDSRTTRAHSDGDATPGGVSAPEKKPRSRTVESQRRLPRNGDPADAERIRKKQDQRTQEIADYLAKFHQSNL